MDFIAAKPLISNLHPRAERSHGGKVLDYKTNCFGRGQGHEPGSATWALDRTTESLKRAISTALGYWARRGHRSHARFSTGRGHSRTGKSCAALRELLIISALCNLVPRQPL
jgi:hypothetical protein